MSILKVPVTASDHSQGNTNAPITLVKYGDYQCPYCGKAYYVVKKLQKHFGPQLRFVFRNFPLVEIHPFAEPAAEAAEFAARYGLFWQMHDLIYENQEALSLPLLVQLAEKLNLSADELEKSIEEKGFENKIHEDFMGGVRSGVNGTPTFFINGQRYDGSFEFEDLLEALSSISVK